MKNSFVIIPVFFLFIFKITTQQKIFPGADEKTPSRSEYFSWINNTNKETTEAQSMVNLEFFK